MADDYQIPAVEWREHIAVSNRAKSQAIANATKGRRQFVQIKAELEQRLDTKARVFLREYEKCQDYQQKARLMIDCGYASYQFAECDEKFISEEFDKNIDYLKRDYPAIWQNVQREKAERKPEQKSLF